jgi:hypothetical protein
MPKAKKRGPGRPRGKAGTTYRGAKTTSTGRRDPMIGVRLPPKLRADIERWAAKQPDRPVLSEAVRRLCQLGLTK